MNLIVFGATGPTGLQVVRQALAAGHRVAAVTRGTDEYPLTSPDLDIVSADVTDAGAVERAMSGREAVISTVGVPYGRRKITVYSEGITAIVRAMASHQIQRLVCVSSTTVAKNPAPADPLMWRTIAKPLLRYTLGRTLYDDMDRMETIVQASDLDWTIVRPAALFDSDEPSVDYEVAPRRLSGSFTSRADLAQILVREATEPQHRRRIIEVITRSGTPSFFRTFLKEAFGIG